MSVIFVGVVVLLVGACAWARVASEDIRLPTSHVTTRSCPLDCRRSFKVTSTSGSIAAANALSSFYIIITNKILYTQQNVY